MYNKEDLAKSYGMYDVLRAEHVLRNAASLHGLLRIKNSQPQKITELIEEHLQDLNLDKDMYIDSKEKLPPHMVITNDVLSEGERKELSQLTLDYDQLTDNQYQRSKFLTLKEEILFDVQIRKEVGELSEKHKYEKSKIPTILNTLKRVTSIYDLRIQRKRQPSFIVNLINMHLSKSGQTNFAYYQPKEKLLSDSNLTGRTSLTEKDNFSVSQNKVCNESSPNVKAEKGYSEQYCKGGNVKRTFENNEALAGEFEMSNERDNHSCPDRQEKRKEVGEDTNSISSEDVVMDNESEVDKSDASNETLNLCRALNDKHG